MTSYAYDFMDVKKFHDEGIKGQGIKVAVMDSGIQKHTHLDIKGGVNAYDGSRPYDSDINNGHGTRVAGVIAMKQNQINGTVGVAPNVDLYAIRIDDGEGGSTGEEYAAQINGINWAIENGIDVLICSFSSLADNKERKEAFKRAYDAGMAIFCSAGNRQGSYDLRIDRMFYPSNYPFVVTSANVSADKKRYISSSVGRFIDFSSGGESILTTTISANSVSNNYSKGTGTSYANPAVAGMYCLYKNKYPEDSREKILQRMSVNSERIGPYFFYGAGIPRYPTRKYENIAMRGRILK